MIRELLRVFMVFDDSRRSLLVDSLEKTRLLRFCGTKQRLLMVLRVVVSGNTFSFSFESIRRV